MQLETLNLQDNFKKCEGIEMKILMGKLVPHKKENASMN
jgi:hypothetical protein